MVLECAPCISNTDNLRAQKPVPSPTPSPHKRSLSPHIHATPSPHHNPPLPPPLTQKTEQRDLLLGQAFLYAALAQGGALTAPQDAAAAIEALLCVAQSKPFMRELVMSVVLTVIGMMVVVVVVVYVCMLMVQYIQCIAHTVHSTIHRIVLYTIVHLHCTRELMCCWLEYTVTSFNTHTHIYTHPPHTHTTHPTQIASPPHPPPSTPSSTTPQPCAPSSQPHPPTPTPKPSF